AYRLLLGRPADAHGLRQHTQRLRQGSATVTDVCAELVASPEFTARLKGGPATIDAQVARTPDLVDVRQLIGQLDLDELSLAADDYYKDNLANVDGYLAKPLATVDEAPDLLACFAVVLATLRPLPGMRVLDFGAGVCWSTRWLAQLGCEAIACDVAETALEVGRQLFERMPVAGNKPAPTFLRFDGRRIDLPDESVDRIVCLDAFHHVPNPADVLAELGRVLRPGGVAGFTEPGPDHSVTAQSQFEMRNYTVVENDVLMGEVWRDAQRAGFDRLELALFSSEPHRVGVVEYEDFLAPGVGPAATAYVEHVRDFAAGRRIFFLGKGEPITSDSRDRRGLLATLAVRLDGERVAPGRPVTGRATVANTGTGLWLGSSAPVGGVAIGVHLYDAGGKLVDRDFARVELPAPDAAGVRPGTSLDVALEVPAPGPGRWRLGFDLVSEGVCWFEVNGSPVVELPVEVAPG
ncbi:MAG: methyltransferase domain-containing protein, partial [Acidimicrobiia bacterium]|nr:methyltransferase domain-containing protein [Acidimicrobiia bacterium]